MIKSKIVRDTALLTSMQLFLDTGALLLNVFITKKLGASAIGILSLMGSFLGLAGILSNGNAFLCTSRFVSEELGRKGGDPEGILAHAVKLCLLLSAGVSVAVFVLAEPISLRFFSGADMTAAIRLMPVALVTGAVSACLKGYFNASRRAGITAACEIAEFVTRCAVIVGAAMLETDPDENRVCSIMTGGMIAGNIVSMVLLSVTFMKQHQKRRGRCTLSFAKYASLCFPIMGGSLLTAILSSTNDALIPICQRQHGDSTVEALSKFGIFEAIVIPAIFFPSVIFCSMSGIIVSETARAKAAADNSRIRSFTERIIAWTLMFSVFSAAVIMRFGRQLGELLDGGELAGSMITLIAPVIPFIYMEIVLEAVIKGLGMQSFSSVNYLIEYVIRISAVLILIPHIGFYGVVISYYASNIFGNCSRYIKVTKATGARRALCGTILLPLLLAVVTVTVGEMFLKLTKTGEKTVLSMIVYTILWGGAYFSIFCSLGKVKLFCKCGEDVFGDTAQQTTGCVR